MMTLTLDEVVRRSGKAAADALVQDWLTCDLLPVRRGISPFDVCVRGPSPPPPEDPLWARFWVLADMIIRGTPPLSDYTIAKKPFAGDGWSFHVTREERPRRRLTATQQAAGAIRGADLFSQSRCASIVLRGAPSPQHDQRVWAWRRRPPKWLKPAPARELREATWYESIHSPDHARFLLPHVRFPPSDKPACGLTSLYRSLASPNETKEEWLKQLGKSSFQINDLPPEDRVLALYAEGKQLAPRAAEPRKKRTEFRDSEYDPACGGDDGPELRESIIDHNDDPTDEGYDSATKPSGYQFKRLKDGLRRTKVDVDVEERDRAHLRNEVQGDPKRLLKLIMGSSNVRFSRQKKGEKPAYEVTSRHCEDILDRVLVPGADIPVECDPATRLHDPDLARWNRTPQSSSSEISATGTLFVRAFNIRP